MIDSHAPVSYSAAETAEIDELASFCFVCGPSNPQGLKLVFTFQAHDPYNITATAQVTLDRLHEGPPGFIHGGIIAALLDEAMGKLGRPLDVIAMTRTMEVEYLAPSPLNRCLTLVGRHLRRDGRKLYQSAELLDEKGRVLARSTGLFIVVRPDFLA